MFKDLEIHNFQSHEDTYLEFSPFVNVILGLSTVRKTSLLRSLRLLTDNRPSGAKFFSNFAGDKGKTSISLGLLPRGNVEIKKEIKINKEGKKECKATHYVLDDGQNEYSFIGVGESVPDQVLQLLNLSELNFQRQFDAPYLISSATSAGEIARTINRLTNLEQVNEWVSSFTSKINESNRDIIALESEIKIIRGELEKYEDLDETGEIINKLSSVQKEQDSVSESREFLSCELIDYQNKAEYLKKLMEFLKAEKYVLKIKKLQDSIDKYWEIKGLFVDYESKKVLVSDKKKPLEDIEPLLIEVKSIIIDPVKVKRDLLNGLCSNLTSLKERMQYLNKVLPEFSQLQGKIKPVDDTDYLLLKQLLGMFDGLKQRITEGKVKLEKAKDLCIQKLKDSQNCPGPLHCELTEIQLREFRKKL